jgi:hypothetical protein
VRAKLVYAVFISCSLLLSPTQKPSMHDVKVFVKQTRFRLIRTRLQLFHLALKPEGPKDEIRPAAENLLSVSC